MWLLTKLAGLFSKTAVDVTKGVTGAASDISNIRKNKLDIKLKQIELEEKESPIKIATFEEIKEYDPKVKAIEIRIKHKVWRNIAPIKSEVVQTIVQIIILLILLLSSVTFILYIVK